jgi:hypothetical protein
MVPGCQSDFSLSGTFIGHSYGAMEMLLFTSISLQAAAGCIGPSKDRNAACVGAHGCTSGVSPHGVRL